MALVVCCPCGNPLECDHLELVVTLVCPHCNQELTLEFEDPQGRRCRGVLTVMEGPHWVGEQFVVPIGTPLKLGSELGNWLALDDPAIAKQHCELRLTDRGNAVVEDAGSEAGTWIGGQRITRGRLAARQSFKLGGFRLRLDFQLNDGTPMATQPKPAAAGLALPNLQKVRPDETPAHWLTSNRYHVSRWLITAFAWSTGAYHSCFLWQDKNQHWEWYYAVAVGVFKLVSLSEIGRRVALVHPYMNYIAIGVLMIFGIVDAAWQMWFPFAAGMAIAACLAVLTIRIPTAAQTVAVILLGATLSVIMIVVTAQQVVAVIEPYLKQ